MDWATLRDQFPVTRHWAFLDHAAVAPLPAPAVRALAAYAHSLAQNGVADVSRWVHHIEEVRRLAGRLLNADPLDIAFIKNTSEGVGIVAEGFPWRPGDNVVIAADEYPANQYPWLNLAHRGVEVRRVEPRDGRIPIDDVRAALTDRTRILSLSSVGFASGFRNDLDALGALCRERGVYFFVDAIQSLGVLPFDVARTPVDYLAADGHKWLLGPEGAGIFWVRRELVEDLHPVGIGWHSVVNVNDYSHIDFMLKPHAGRWESGTMNVPGITALGASLELLLGIGIDAIAERVLALTDYLCERAARAGLTVFSSRRPAERSGIVSFELPGADPKAVVQRCRQEGVIVAPRGGRLRASPHGYNTSDELDRLVEVLVSSP